MDIIRTGLTDPIEFGNTDVHGRALRFGVFGVSDDGAPEPIAGCRSYAEAAGLLVSMMPELSFPREAVAFSASCREGT